MTRYNVAVLSAHVKFHTLTKLLAVPIIDTCERERERNITTTQHSSNTANLITPSNNPVNYQTILAITCPHGQVLMSMCYPPVDPAYNNVHMQGFIKQG